MCGWTNEPNKVSDDIDWIRMNGATPSSQTGPAFDHTFGTGKPLDFVLFLVVFIPVAILVKRKIYIVVVYEIIMMNKLLID